MVHQILTSLLVAFFHPMSEGWDRMRQCLTVFFDTYARGGEKHIRNLADALLPAARQLLQVNSRKNPAPLLIKYLLQLITTSSTGEAGTPSSSGVCPESLTSLVHDITVDVAYVSRCIGSGSASGASRMKAYLAALCKVLSSLPLVQGPHIQTLHALIRYAAPSITDKTVSKDVGVYMAHLDALEGASGVAVSDEEVQRLAEKLQSSGLAALTQLNEPAPTPSHAPSMRTIEGAKKKVTTARKGRSVKSTYHVPDSEEEGDSTATTQRSRRPTRSTRAKGHHLSMKFSHLDASSSDTGGGLSDGDQDDFRKGDQQTAPLSVTTLTADRTNGTRTRRAASQSSQEIGGVQKRLAALHVTQV